MAESKKTVAAETQDRPTAPAETLSELDKLVVRLLTALLMLMKSIILIYSTDGLFCQCLPYIAVRK